MGKTATFEVEVTGDAPETVKWFKSGLQVKETDSRIKMIKVSDFVYQLVITNAELDDKGNYKVL